MIKKKSVERQTEFSFRMPHFDTQYTQHKRQYICKNTCHSLPELASCFTPCCTCRLCGATKTIFYSLILVKRDGTYLRKYFLISDLPEPSVLYGFS